MREVAAAFAATQARIARRFAEVPVEESAAVVDDELRGLYHGLFVIFDGGTALADKGLVQIRSDDGTAFDRFLHEICFSYWPKADA
ncbi:hypothetical protein [Gemmata sp. SH-PL17]|uniref:hypothetical protein n=1 Tax=Gemmata sp. SH-PL17 TaxID=1630693 RepID=UPI0012F7B1DE|nr:hypothetical protein [Gemmata sp. SH-PL17]